jgi:hypothetical protein
MLTGNSVSQSAGKCTIYSTVPPFCQNQPAEKIYKEFDFTSYVKRGRAVRSARRAHISLFYAERNPEVGSSNLPPAISPWKNLNSAHFVHCLIHGIEGFDNGWECAGYSKRRKCDWTSGWEF